MPGRIPNLDIFHFESSDDDVPLKPIVPTQQVPSPSPASSAENQGINPMEFPEKSKSPPHRALRARKPEQQMPYTLDLIRHRDQFRRRGLKPVHNPDAQPRAREDDEQYQADEEEVEFDKNEQYIPPKDIGERPSKRRRLNENEEEEEDWEIQLLSGRKKFLDPRQFNIQKKKFVQQITPDREVWLSMDQSLIFRCRITISV
jgi:hypothetical protein